MNTKTVTKNIYPSRATTPAFMPPENHPLRVQLVIARATTKLSTMLVTGSLPALGQWQGARVMHECGGQWVFDLYFDALEQPNDAIQFDYQYRHLDKAGTQVWASEVSRCSLQLHHLLNHVSDRSHRHHADTKIILYINGVEDTGDDTSLMATGSPPSLGQWNLRRAPVLSRHSTTGMHYKIFFVPRASCLTYACYLVRHARAIFQANHSSLSTLPPYEPAILWDSNVGILELGRHEEACVVLLDLWHGCGGKASEDLTGDQTVQVLDTERETVERLSCKICWECEVACVFTSCGHVCTCWSCAFSVSECPICRQAVAGRLRVYV